MGNCPTDPRSCQLRSSPAETAISAKEKAGGTRTRTAGPGLSDDYSLLMFQSTSLEVGSTPLILLRQAYCWSN